MRTGRYNKVWPLYFKSTFVIKFNLEPFVVALINFILNTKHYSLSLNGKQRPGHSWNMFHLCSTQDRTSYRFGVIWDCATDDIIFIYEWSSPLRLRFLNIQRKLFEAATEQTHSSSFTSLAGTPHSHIWPIKHGSRFLLLIPFTGWSISPPDRYFPGRTPLHREIEGRQPIIPLSVVLTRSSVKLQGRLQLIPSGLS